MFLQGDSEKVLFGPNHSSGVIGKNIAERVLHLPRNVDLTFLSITESLVISIVPDILGEGCEGPAHIEQRQGHRDHIHLQHRVRLRKRDVSLNCNS